MKKIVLFALALAAMPAVAQQYKVAGTAPEGAKVVYLYNAEAGRGSVPDSVVIGADRTFAFAGDAQGHVFGMLSTDRKVFDTMPVMLDGDVNADISTLSLSGTPENVALAKAYEQIFPLQQEQAEINEEAMQMQAAGKLNQETIQPLRERYVKCSTAIAEKTREICAGNQQMLFPAIFLRDAYYEISRSDIIAWSEGGAAFMKSPLLARIAMQIEGWKKQEPGVMFTDLEEADVNGTMHKLSEYVGKGRYVLVDFWASWCGPCMAEMPNVKMAYEKYHAKGFDIVGLSFDQEKSAWLDAIKEKGMTWTHLSDLKGWETVAAKTYGVNSIPATLLIGPDGKIVAAGLRGGALQKKLAEIFGTRRRSSLPYEGKAHRH